MRQKTQVVTHRRHPDRLGKLAAVSQERRPQKTPEFNPRLVTQTRFHQDARQRRQSADKPPLSWRWGLVRLTLQTDEVVVSSLSLARTFPPIM
jgi:hypothetical protein